VVSRYSLVPGFLRELFLDKRIPDRDRKVVIAFLLLIISPLDLVPDWIPFVGVIDDVFLIALMGDYFFRVLDPEIFLGRWPFGLKSFQRLKRFFTSLASPIPKPLRNMIWKYRPSPYRNS